MDLGMAIKTLRQHQGVSQGELADRCGVNINTVSAWETGKAWPQRGVAERVCEALGVPTSYLMLAAIQIEDVPEEKRVLYRTLLEPLRHELFDKQEP